MAATSSYTDAVNEALQRLQGVGYEFGPSFVNHAPMAAEALAYLGYSDIVASWTDRVIRSRGFHDPPDSRYRLAGDDRGGWEAALGDFSRVADWSAMFERELAEEPWADVLHRWWPRLIPGMAGVLGHGVIRTAHAVRALVLASGRGDELQRSELAHGLGYWAARYRAGADAASRQPLTDPGSGTTGTGTTGPQGERAATLQALDELIAESATFYARTPQSFPVPLIHTITAPAAVRLICHYLPDLQCWSSYLAARRFSDALRTRFSSGSPVSEGEIPVPPILDLVGAAVELGDEHAIKLAEVAIRQYALTGDESCLSASAVATRLIGRFPV